MLKDEIKKKIKLKNDTKNYLSQLKIICQIHNPGHEIDITS
jgi:hypothetical protein